MEAHVFGFVVCFVVFLPRTPLPLLGPAMIRTGSALGTLQPYRASSSGCRRHLGCIFGSPRANLNVGSFALVNVDRFAVLCRLIMSRPWETRLTRSCSRQKVTSEKEQPTSDTTKKNLPSPQLSPSSQKSHT
jgi:hypothetical protein